jgi:hypothetical protein
MPKIILFSYIEPDGIGDCTHLIEIYNELVSNPTYKDLNVSVIVSSDSIDIRKKFAKLPCLSKYFFYLGDGQDPEPDADETTPEKIRETLSQDLKDADQFITISSRHSTAFKGIRRYANLINPQALFKHITEHEGDDTVFDERFSVYRMGLSSGCLGIKLRPTPKTEIADAVNTIKKNDPGFSDILVNSTESKDIEDFLDKNLLIPAYFNRKDDFVRFLLFLAMNEIMPQKDIAIYLSGGQLNREPVGDEIIYSDSRFFGKHWQSYISYNIIKEIIFSWKIFENTDIKQIEIIERGKNKKITREMNNQNGKRNVRIYCGFCISDNSYNALFQSAKMVGISGDNTVEKAINCGVLFYYYSTNFHFKSRFLAEIASIVEQTDLDDQIKKDLLLFFNPREFDEFALPRTGGGRDQAAMEKFRKLNLIRMIEAWPIINAHIVRKYNFFDNLPEVILGTETPRLSATGVTVPRSPQPINLTSFSKI